MVSARGCGKQTVVLGWLGVGVLLAACQTTGLNPTGLHGTEVRCSEGPRQTLDCRGAIQQYARDLKADVSVAKQVTLGLGVVSTKLIEADAITSGNGVASRRLRCSKSASGPLLPEILEVFETPRRGG